MGWHLMFLARWNRIMSLVDTLPSQLLSQGLRVDAACSQRQTSPPFDMQNLGGVWVHVPPLIICGPHSFWPSLQKSNTPP